MVFSQEVVDGCLLLSVSLEALGGGLEEADDDPRKVVGFHVERVDDRADLFVGQQALVQALVQEVVVQ